MNQVKFNFIHRSAYRDVIKSYSGLQLCSFLTKNMVPLVKSYFFFTATICFIFDYCYIQKPVSIQKKRKSFTLTHKKKKKENKKKKKENV